MARNETTNGDLRTPVVFYDSKIEDGVDGQDISYKEKFRTFAEVYNPSQKDIEIASGHGVISRFTLKIRDPLTSYIPQNKHYVEILDNRLSGKKYEIIDIRPDFIQKNFLVVLVGGGGDD